MTPKLWAQMTRENVEISGPVVPRGVNVALVSGPFVLFGFLSFWLNHFLGGQNLIFTVL